MNKRKLVNKTNFTIIFIIVVLVALFLIWKLISRPLTTLIIVGVIAAIVYILFRVLGKKKDSDYFL